MRVLLSELGNFYRLAQEASVIGVPQDHILNRVPEGQVRHVGERAGHSQQDLSRALNSSHLRRFSLTSGHPPLRALVAPNSWSPTSGKTAGRPTDRGCQAWSTAPVL